MSTTTPSRDPREALAESERKANESHPQNFKEAETEEKRVEILPIDGEGAPIEGIDPDEAR